MKKNKWNTVIFLWYLAYCLFFLILFWRFFGDNDLFDKYYNLTYKCLLITFGVNTMSQILAIIAKQKFAIRWLISGAFSLFLTIAFTVGQSV